MNEETQLPAQELKFITKFADFGEYFSVDLPVIAKSVDESIKLILFLHQGENEKRPNRIMETHTFNILSDLYQLRDYIHERLA